MGLFRKGELISETKFPTIEETAQRAKEVSYFSVAVKYFFKNKLATFGFTIITVFFLSALFAEFLPLRDPLEMNGARFLEPPSSEYLLGTDGLGRDILSRLVYGARSSFYVAGVSVLISTLLGTLIGMLSGYFGGFVEILLMRFMDILFAFPAVLLGLSIIAAFGPNSNNVILAISVVYTPIFARIALGSTRSVKEKQFVESAVAVGCRDSRILLLHVLPNILAPIIVQVSLALSWALLTEAVFSFLGLGAQPPDPSWGVMLNEGKGFMELAPWMAIYPGIAIMLAVLGFNLLGDGLREILDPRMKKA